MILYKRSYHHTKYLLCLILISRYSTHLRKTWTCGIVARPSLASKSRFVRGENPVYKVVRTSRLYEQIVQQIEESVLNGKLKPGDQLPAERELAQQLGVSRTAVREAVKALREKGLVEAYS